MSKFKGTKAPWTYDIDQQSVLSKNGFVIADIFAGDKLANGLLISKAPEMLKMLEWCLLDDKINDYTREKMEQLVKSATEL